MHSYQLGITVFDFCILVNTLHRNSQLKPNIESKALFPCQNFHIEEVMKIGAFPLHSSFQENITYYNIHKVKTKSFFVHGLVRLKY